MADVRNPLPFIVAQTLPYSSSDLNLDDPKRWIRLLPLMRPSMKVVETSKGEVVVVDTALVKSPAVLVVAVTSAQKFSSTILNGSHIAAFVIDSNSRTTAAEEIFDVLRNEGLPIENGAVAVRSCGEEELKGAKEVRATNDFVELLVVEDVKFDHVLFLLGKLTCSISYSVSSIKLLLQSFVDNVRTTGVTVATSLNSNVEWKFLEETRDPSAEAAEKWACNNMSQAAKQSIDRQLDIVQKSRCSSTESQLIQDPVYSIHFSDVNGLARLEINLLIHGIVERMTKENKQYYITQSSIFDLKLKIRGYQISLLHVDPSHLPSHLKPTTSLHQASSENIPTSPRLGNSSISFSDAELRKIIKAGCAKVIIKEPTITEYDTIVGDGDCGYTLRDGAKQVLKFIENADLAQLPSTLNALVDDLEVNMGGTSGALYCIFLSSLAQNLVGAKDFPPALKSALQHLLKYTKARLGDRTCLDCLIPFVESLEKGSSPRDALEQAKAGVKRTEKMEAKLGRSSYLDESATRGVPDPGAYGLLMLLEGMVGAAD